MRSIAERGWARKLTLLLAVAVAGPPAAAESILQDQVFVAALDRGLARLYNFELAAAEREFAAATAGRSGHPTASFLAALPNWWRVLADPDDAARRAPVRAAAEETLVLCARRFEAAPRDPDARFFQGAALALRGRARVMDREWIAAAWDGKRALDLVRELHREQPGNDDLYYGLGLYHYYAEVVPREYPIFRPLKPFFPAADRRRGLAELERAFRFGRFAKVEAAYALLEIHYLWEENARGALEYASWLHARYSANPIFHLYLGRSHALARDWGRARPILTAALERSARGAPGYGPAQAELARYFLARGALEESDYSEALAEVARLEQGARRRGSVSRYRALGQLVAGMALDALGRRAEAVASYRRVLELRDGGGANRRARGYLREPFRPRKTSQ